MLVAASHIRKAPMIAAGFGQAETLDCLPVPLLRKQTLIVFQHDASHTNSAATE